MQRVREERGWAWTSDAPSCLHKLWGQVLEYQPSVQKENNLELFFYVFLEKNRLKLGLFRSYHWLCAAVKKSRCGSKWSCTRCKLGREELEESEKNLGKRDIGDDELGHEVKKLIYKAWLGCAKNGIVDTETKSCQSEAEEGVPVNGEGTDAMEKSSLNVDESIEALEEWLKKN